MTSLDLSLLSGPDAVAALRSYPRRFRAAILPVDDPDAEELAYQIGPNGHSAIDLVVHTTHSFVILGEALRQVLVGEDPVLHPGVADGAEREWDVPPGTSIGDALDRLDDEATRLADMVARIEGPDWGRSGRVAGGPVLSALDLAKEAVRTGATDLREVTATLAALRDR